jgi:hypothetical protein
LARIRRVSSRASASRRSECQAALRWHARYYRDNKVSIEEATAVLGLLAMLEGRRAKPAAQTLAGLLNSRTLLPAAEVLVRWADRADVK